MAVARISTIRCVAHDIKMSHSGCHSSNRGCLVSLSIRSVCNRCMWVDHVRREGKGGGKKGGKGGKGGGGGGGGGAADKAVVVSGGGDEGAKDKDKDKELELDEFLEAFEQELEVGGAAGAASARNSTSTCCTRPWWEEGNTVMGRAHAGACMATVRPEIPSNFWVPRPKTPALVRWPAPFPAISPQPAARRRLRYPAASTHCTLHTCKFISRVQRGGPWPLPPPLTLLTTSFLLPPCVCLAPAWAPAGEQQHPAGGAGQRHEPAGPAGHHAPQGPGVCCGQAQGGGQGPA